MISRRESVSPVTVHLETRRDEDWRQFANCAGLDVSDFVPDNRGGQVPEQVLRVCGSCEVVQDCLDFAIKNGIREGIYGGVSPTQRRKLRLGDPAPILTATCEACGGRKRTARNKYCDKASCRSPYARAAAAARAAEEKAS